MKSIITMFKCIIRAAECTAGIYAIYYVFHDNWGKMNVRLFCYFILGAILIIHAFTCLGCYYRDEPAPLFIVTAFSIIIPSNWNDVKTATLDGYERDMIKEKVKVYNDAYRRYWRK